MKQTVVGMFSGWWATPTGSGGLKEEQGAPGPGLPGPWEGDRRGCRFGDGAGAGSCWDDGGRVGGALRSMQDKIRV